MPGHVHSLASEPELEVLAKAIQALNIPVARRAMSYGTDRPREYAVLSYRRLNAGLIIRVIRGD